MAATMTTMAKKRSSNRAIEYKCTRCDSKTQRSKLTVKRVLFQTMGEGFRTLKSRTTDWLCPVCLKGDPAWTQDKLTAAPGLADVREEPQS